VFKSRFGVRRTPCLEKKEVFGTSFSLISFKNLLWLTFRLNDLKFKNQICAICESSA